MKNPSFIVPVLTRYGAIVAQFAMVALITRALSPAASGSFFVLMGIVLASYFLAGAGLPDGQVKNYPAEVATGNSRQANATLVRGTWFSLATVPLGAAGSAAAALLVGESLPSALFVALWWLAYAVIFIAAQTLVALGRTSVGTGIFYSSAPAAQILIAAPAILVTRQSTLEGILLCVTIATSIAAVLSLTVLGRELVVLHRRSSERLSELPPGPRTPLLTTWRDGIPIAIGRVAQAILIWSPVWAAGLVLGSEDAGIIGLATRLVSAVAAVVAAIRFSIRPSIAQAVAIGSWRELEARSSRIALYVTVLAVVAMAGFLLAGPTFVNWIFGDGYTGAAWVAATLLIGTVAESIGGPVDEILKMSGDAHRVLWFQLIAIAIGFPAQIMFGQVAGVLGLCLAYGATFALLYAMSIVYLWKRRAIFVFAR